MVMVTGCAGNRIIAGRNRGIAITFTCEITDINAYIL